MPSWSSARRLGNSLSNNLPFSYFAKLRWTICASRQLEYHSLESPHDKMPAFKDPGFQQRREEAGRAKNAALAAYRAKPPVDEAVMAERTARRVAREAAEVQKRAEALRAKEEAADAKREQERQAVAAAEASARAQAEAAATARAEATAQKQGQRKAWTEADRKAARDARYAARKMRAGRR